MESQIISLSLQGAKSPADLKKLFETPLRLLNGPLKVIGEVVKQPVQLPPG